MTRVIGLTRLETLYKTFAGLDLDKGRAQQILEIAEKKLEDLFRAAQERAWARGSDTVEWIDLPITLGLKNTMEEYKRKREELGDPRLDLEPIVQHLTEAVSSLVLGETVREALQDLTATVLLLIGYIIKKIDPKAKKPSKEAIERARGILDLTL